MFVLYFLFLALLRLVHTKTLLEVPLLTGGIFDKTRQDKMALYCTGFLRRLFAGRQCVRQGDMSWACICTLMTGAGAMSVHDAWRTKLRICWQLTLTLTLTLTCTCHEGYQLTRTFSNPPRTNSPDTNLGLGLGLRLELGVGRVGIGRVGIGRVGIGRVGSGRVGKGVS